VGAREPIAVTGLGVVSAFGLGRAAFVRGLASGESAFGPLTLFPSEGFRASRVAELRERLPPAPLPGRLARRLSRCDRLGLAAALEAAADARLEALSRERIGIVLGAGAGGMLEAEEYFEGYWKAQAGGGAAGDPRGAHVLASQLPNATTDWVALALGLEGPRSTIATACSSSASAIGYAADLLAAGRADAVLAGGAEALSRVTLAGFNALRAIDPAGPRPFDTKRAGMGLGEGAAVLVLERLSSARARGARVRALVLGWGLGADAFHMTNPHPEGEGALRAMRLACEDAGVSPGAIDHVNAHGTATPANDLAEALAIRRLIGAAREPSVAVCSVKGALGHTLGAAGAVEAAAVVVAAEEGFVPPTAGLADPDPACGALDMVRGEARRRPVALAISSSFAFGGNDAALVIACAPS
jgi:3-oxoacyl-[acyl-carrier-protein] synthase II